MKPVKELLQEVNGNMVNIEKYKPNTALVSILQYAFDESKKFKLPDGTPPFREEGIPDGFGYSNLYAEIRKFNIFNREDLTPFKRESIFITMLESLEPSEREILILIKEQNLTSKYPNITKEAVQVLL